MPRSSDRIARHLLEGSGDSDKHRKRRSIVILRPRFNSDGKVPMSVRLRENSTHSLNPQLVTSTVTSADETEDTVTVHDSMQRISVINGDDGEVEVVVDDEKPVLLNILEETNMDGVRHLKSENRATRYLWAVVIIGFGVLALIQIYTQILMYYTTPVATNIEAEYPPEIIFPTVAICNNNQYRLTFLTGPRIQNRRPAPHNGLKSVDSNSTNVFDKSLQNTWDLDAVKFLRSAAHWKSRMILRCHWPNGTACKTTDFKAVWTLTGLCWAINTDPQNPAYITGSGPGHGLKLLLNIEKYERVESCTPKFRTTSLPGLKILIYNQTDIPISSLDGVNVPPGYSMDIPFRMQHRQKFPGQNCIAETDTHREAAKDFNSPDNIRTCAIRQYLEEIEARCGCSLRKAYDPNPNERYPFCNVDEYFHCVVPLLQRGTDSKWMKNPCYASCEQMDYIAWQDMNLLPNNIFPSLIETAEDEDTSFSDMSGDIDEEIDNNMVLAREEHFKCEDNQLLDDSTIAGIKRQAKEAYEKQARYQEDILLRSERMISRLQAAATKLIDLKWGWHNEDFIGVYERLSSKVSCYQNMTARHADVSNALTNPAAHGEERKASQIFMIIDPDHHRLYPSLYKTIGELKRVYGDVVEKTQKELDGIENMIKRLHEIYDEDNFNSQLVGHNLNRMDRILQLVEQYNKGKLQRKVWAEKMQSRNMRHFFEEDFYDGWYNPILRDLDQNIVKAINDIEYDLPEFFNLTLNGTGLKTGSILLFGDANVDHVQKLSEFLDDIISCTVDDVKNESISILKEFRNAMHEFQGAYSNLFKKELPDYLENFDFGQKFIRENFAQVNVFLHKMNVEHWKQHSTYSIWSLACDVGGALGLFLGVSLLTIIEFIYLCYSCCRTRWMGPEAKKWLSNKKMKIKVMTEKRWNAYRDAHKNDVMTRSLVEEMERQRKQQADNEAEESQVFLDRMYNEIDGVIIEEDDEEYRDCDFNNDFDRNPSREHRTEEGLAGDQVTKEPSLSQRNARAHSDRSGNGSSKPPLPSLALEEKPHHFMKRREQKRAKQPSPESPAQPSSLSCSQTVEDSESTNTTTDSSSAPGATLILAPSSHRQTTV
uniref:Amiloride-sensitive sodium channel subunit alpha n=1 Tax=Steinernema glaseri TaxID=37863 RepID=A0A1I7ZEP0_9BILA